MGPDATHRGPLAARLPPHACRADDETQDRRDDGSQDGHVRRDGHAAMVGPPRRFPPTSDRRW